MRYVFPKTKNIVKNLILEDLDIIYTYSTYPHYSFTTTRSSYNDFVCEILEKNTRNIIIKSNMYFSMDNFYIDYFCKQIQSLYVKAEKFGKPIVLCSAHGVPLKKIKKGDCYKKQCFQTINEIIRRNRNIENDIILCFQSKIGVMEWLSPYLIDCINEYSCQKRPIIIIPLSFLVENMETIYELHKEMRDIAIKMGCPFFLVAPTPSENHEFLAAFSKEIEKLTDEPVFL